MISRILMGVVAILSGACVVFRLGICGANADINGLKFPLASQCLNNCDTPTH